jgi:hypothetical protein
MILFVVEECRGVENMRHLNDVLRFFSRNLLFLLFTMSVVLVSHAVQIKPLSIQGVSRIEDLVVSRDGSRVVGVVRAGFRRALVTRDPKDQAFSFMELPEEMRGMRDWLLSADGARLFVISMAKKTLEEQAPASNFGVYQFQREKWSSEPLPPRASDISHLALSLDGSKMLGIADSFNSLYTYDIRKQRWDRKDLRLPSLERISPRVWLARDGSRIFGRVGQEAVWMLFARSIRGEELGSLHTKNVIGKVLQGELHLSPDSFKVVGEAIEEGKQERHVLLVWDLLSDELFVGNLPEGIVNISAVTFSPSSSYIVCPIEMANKGGLYVYYFGNKDSRVLELGNDMKSVSDVHISEDGSLVGLARNSEGAQVFFIYNREGKFEFYPIPDEDFKNKGFRLRKVSEDVFLGFNTGLSVGKLLEISLRAPEAVPQPVPPQAAAPQYNEALGYKWVLIDPTTVLTSDASLFHGRILIAEREYIIKQVQSHPLFRNLSLLYLEKPVLDLPFVKRYRARVAPGRVLADESNELYLFRDERTGETYFLGFMGLPGGEKQLSQDVQQWIDNSIIARALSGQ